MNTYVRYPIALKRDTKKLVHPFEVENGLNCNCYCPECDENLIAINKEKNKQIDHFRHQRDTKCTGSYETYIHWLSKEIFKEIDAIKLPEIRFKNLYENYLDKFKDFETRLYNLYSKYYVPKEFRQTYKYDFLIQEKSTFKIDKSYDEKTFKTDKGDYRADIVAEYKNNKILIEPYYSNPIDSIKYNKIVNSNITTLSIDLKPFVGMNNFIYTIEDFKNFITSDINSKFWIFIRKEKVKNLTEKFFYKLENKIKENVTVFKKHKSIKDKISLIENEKNDLFIEMEKLRDKVQILISKTKKEKKELKDLETDYYKRFK